MQPEHRKHNIKMLPVYRFLFSGLFAMHIFISHVCCGHHLSRSVFICFLQIYVPMSLRKSIISDIFPTKNIFCWFLRRTVTINFFKLNYKNDWSRLQGWIGLFYFYYFMKFKPFLAGMYTSYETLLCIFCKNHKMSLIVLLRMGIKMYTLYNPDYKAV